MDMLFASTQPGQTGGGILSFLPFILIMFIIYFLMIRPQNKRQKEKQIMRDNLNKGDKVITMGGIHGIVSGFKEKGAVIVIKVDRNTNLNLSKTAIAGLSKDVTNEDLEHSS